MKEDVLIWKASRFGFDVIGRVDAYLILGLASTPERNIDEFVIADDGSYKFIGFGKHFGLKVKELVDMLENHTHIVKQVRFPELTMKTLAIRAGIGAWGKNSLVMHPIFGPWLRFVVIKFDDLSSELMPEDDRRTVPLCTVCDQCVKVCPTQALQPFTIPDRTKCLAYLSENGKTYERCDKCLTVCPITYPRKPGNRW